MNPGYPSQNLLLKMALTPICCSNGDNNGAREPGAVQLLDKIITIHRVKQVVTASLKLRDYDGQVAEAMPMIQK